MYNTRQKGNEVIRGELNRFNINTKQYLKVCEDITLTELLTSWTSSTLMFFF
jgi:hypothetical protein